MNTAVAMYEHPKTAVAVRMQVNLVQEVMQAVMKEGTHYGKIPGTPKPSLWKPGCEVLAATFHIAPSYKVEDLSGPDFTRYRVTCIGTHQGSGVVLGEGMGECSSLEEKYKWRKASSEKEFENTPEDRRRIKYGKDYTAKQVRTEHADQSNTILKMACKRAQVAMTLNVVAASDIFTQDIEDLPEELRPDDEAGGAQPPKGPQQKAEPKPGVASGPADPNKLLPDNKKKILRARMDSARVSEEDIAKQFGKPLDQLADSLFNEVQTWIREQGDKRS